MTAAVSQLNHGSTKNKEAPQTAPQDVGLLFVREYYTFLNKKPHRLHAFYSKDSYFVRGDEGETVTTFHGQEAIRSKIEQLNFEDCKVLVTQVDSQLSANGGILIQVLGEMCVMDGPSQKFSQSFFLAPQPNGYYVLNDIFRFLKDEVDIDYYTCDDKEEKDDQPKVNGIKQQDNEPMASPTPSAVAATEPAPAPPAPAAPVQEQQAPIEPVAAASQEPAKEQTPAPAPAAAATQKAPAAAPAAEAPSAPSTAPATPAKPEAPKSWADLASKNMAAQAAATPASPVKEHAQAPAVTPASPIKEQAQPSQPPAQQSSPQQQPKEHRKEEVVGIFVKHVFNHVTTEQLHEAFSKFGAIKSLTMGTNGRTCAYIDFETPEAAQKALAQNKVVLSSKHTVLAEERRPRPSAPRQQANGYRHQGSFYRRGNSNAPNANPSRGSYGGGGAGSKSRNANQK
ncbi:hypothetical protein BC940DRAFT_342631 [Gongronella butleri]|nr:hypothetical protein BC940DRAFT_342631 [Gongronella butleri]